MSMKEILNQAKRNLVNEDVISKLSVNETQIFRDAMTALVDAKYRGLDASAITDYSTYRELIENYLISPTTGKKMINVFFDSFGLNYSRYEISHEFMGVVPKFRFNKDMNKDELHVALFRLHEIIRDPSACTSVMQIDTVNGVKAYLHIYTFGALSYAAITNSEYNMNPRPTRFMVHSIADILSNHAWPAESQVL